MDIFLAPSRSWQTTRQATIESLERRIGKITLPVVDLWGLASIWYLFSSVVAGTLGAGNGTAFQACWTLSAILVVMLSPAGLLAVCIQRLFAKVAEINPELACSESRG